MCVLCVLCVSLSLRLKELLGPVTRVKKRVRARLDSAPYHPGFTYLWVSLNFIFIVFAVLYVPYWLDSGWALTLSASVLTQNSTGDADASGRGVAAVRGGRGRVVPRAHARQPGPKPSQSLNPTRCRARRGQRKRKQLKRVPKLSH